MRGTLLSIGPAFICIVQPGAFPETPLKIYPTALSREHRFLVYSSPRDSDVEGKLEGGRPDDHRLRHECFCFRQGRLPQRGHVKFALTDFLLVLILLIFIVELARPTFFRHPVYDIDAFWILPSRQFDLRVTLASSRSLQVTVVS